MSAADRVRAVLDEIDAGEHATSGRQFGQGMAHASKLVRAALAEPIETRVWIVETPRDSAKGERSSKHLLEWIVSNGGHASLVSNEGAPGERKIRVYGVGVLWPGDSLTFDGKAFTITKGES